jgi:NADPH:quinone reductase-like Zn-dependent oxidoreductase
MKALQFFAPAQLDCLRIRDIDDPGEPGPTEVRIRILSSSLNGHDYNVALGRLPVAEGRILLTDGAGIVEAVGSNVREFGVGDLVVSTFFPDWKYGNAPQTDFSRTPGDGIDGHGSEIVVRPANWYLHAPRGWTAQQAATLPTAGLTAWRAVVDEGRVQPGHTVLVLGTGGVSLFALQFAKQMGARVIVTSSSDEKLEFAKQCGADGTVNYRSHPQWAAEVRRLTDGQGVDLVVETAGPGTLPQSISAVRTGGRIVLVGVLTGIQGAVPTVALMAKQIILSGITVGSHEQQRAMIRALESTDALPVIDAEYPLTEIGNAFRHQESGAHFGKIVINI